MINFHPFHIAVYLTLFVGHFENEIPLTINHGREKSTISGNGSDSSDSSATKFSDFKHIVGKLEFLWADYIIQRYFAFVSTVELRTLYIQELPYMNTFCECILKKIGLTYAHFQ